MKLAGKLNQKTHWKKTDTELYIREAEDRLTTFKESQTGNFLTKVQISRVNEIFTSAAYIAAPAKRKESKKLD